MNNSKSPLRASDENISPVTIEGLEEIAKQFKKSDFQRFVYIKNEFVEGFVPEEWTKLFIPNPFNPTVFYSKPLNVHD